MPSNTSTPPRCGDGDSAASPPHSPRALQPGLSGGSSERVGFIRAEREGGIYSSAATLLLSIRGVLVLPPLLGRVVVVRGGRDRLFYPSEEGRLPVSAT